MKIEFTIQELELINTLFKSLQFKIGKSKEMALAEDILKKTNALNFNQGKENGNKG